MRPRLHRTSRDQDVVEARAEEELETQMANARISRSPSRVGAASHVWSGMAAEKVSRELDMCRWPGEACRKVDDNPAC